MKPNIHTFVFYLYELSCLLCSNFGVGALTLESTNPHTYTAAAVAVPPQTKERSGYSITNLASSAANHYNRKVTLITFVVSSHYQINTQYCNSPV